MTPPPDYHALRAELDLPEYAGLSDADAAAHFNARTATIDAPLVGVSTLRAWAAREGARKPIEDAITGVIPGLPGPIVSICLSLRDFLQSGGDPLDLSSPSNQSMVDGLVSAGVLTAAQRDSLYALRSATVPYCTTTGFPVPASAADVAVARSL